MTERSVMSGVQSPEHHAPPDRGVLVEWRRSGSRWEAWGHDSRRSDDHRRSWNVGTTREKSRPRRQSLDHLTSLVGIWAGMETVEVTMAVNVLAVRQSRSPDRQTSLGK